MPSLFQLGDFTLNSGARSKWKLECDSLTADDWRALAEMVRQLVGPFSSVEGVPRGGLMLAAALKPFSGMNGPHLLVDDVLTTGGSMERAKAKELATPYYTQNGANIVGAVVFARGQRPTWIKAIFEMPECFWLTPRHR